MSPRQQSREQRRELREALLQECRNGGLRPGDALPPLRELAVRHGLSPATAQRVLRELSDEGILQIRQGSGAFLGHFPEQGECAFAAMATGNWNFGDHMKALLSGFEGEISRRSGTALAICGQTPGLSSLLESIERAELPIGGAFFINNINTETYSADHYMARALGDCPLTVYHGEGWPKDEADTGPAHDTICFDDEGGSRLAVQHLRRRGHRDIAFLALHTRGGSSATDFLWSRKREAGFRDVMGENGREPVVIYPDIPVASLDSLDQIAAAKISSRRLLPHLKQGRIKAVVCVNKFALEGLVHTAREEKLPTEFWPAIIAFDDASRDNHLLSVLKLPWDELGRLAAANLWERVFGAPAEKAAPPREIRVPMRLVARPSGLERDHSLGFDYPGTLTHHLVTA